jgi:hypothetical protein
VSLVAALCLTSCGDKKAMQDRLKAAEAEEQTIQAQSDTANRQYTAAKQNNSDMEKLLFSQVEEADPKKKKKPVGNRKPLTVESAASTLQEKNAALVQQKQVLEQQVKDVETDLAAYRARFNK